MDSLLDEIDEIVYLRLGTLTQSSVVIRLK